MEKRLKNFLLIVFGILFVGFFVYATLTTTLTSPGDGYRNITGEFNLTCSVTDGAGIVNVTLYHNFTGTWAANSTVDLTGTSNSTYWNFSGVDSGNYIWNCLSYNSLGDSSWAGSNRTLISGGYQAWNVSNQTGDYTPATFSGKDTFRNIIKADNIYYGGDKIRVKFYFGSSDASIVNPTIGQRNGSTSNIVPGTLVNLTFEGAKNYTLSAGQTVWSDWVDFNFSSRNDYLLSFYTGDNSSLDNVIFYADSGVVLSSYFVQNHDATSNLTWASSSTTTNIYGMPIDLETSGSYPFPISLNSPSNSSQDSDGAVKFNFSLDEGNVDYTNCTLYTNQSGSWASNETLTSPSLLVNVFDEIIFPKNFNYQNILWGVKCANSDNTFWSTENNTVFLNYTYVTYGDSVTWGQGASTGGSCTSDCKDWSFLLSNASNLNYTEINSGQSGTFTNTTGVNSVNGAVVTHKSKAVFLQYGLNDVRIGVNLTDFDESYDYIVRTILNSTNATLVVGTLNHMSSYSASAPYDKGNRTIHGEFNNIIQEIAVENNLSVSQIYYEMHYNDSLLDDGIHPNDDGHELIARLHNYSFWNGEIQTSEKWDVYSSVGNFNFQNYTFNMSQNPHETNTTFIIEDMQLYNFSVNTTQSVDVVTASRYSANTQYDLLRTSLNGGSSSTSTVTSGSSGRLSFTIPAGNYSYNISLHFSSSTPAATTDTSDGSSGIGTYKPSKSVLENGYTTNVVSGQKVQVLFDGSYRDVEVKSVSEDKVVVTVNNQDYEISSSASGKIDLDSDGFYDVEITSNKIYSNGIASLEFKLINEEVPKEIQEEQQGNVEDNNSSEEKVGFWKNIGNFFSRIWDWISFWN